MTDHDHKTCDDLWRRARAAEVAWWMPGMLTVYGWRVVHRELGMLTIASARSGRVHVVLPGPDWLPDWTDHATVGCLLAMARGGVGDPHALAFWDAFEGAWCCVWSGTASRWRDRSGATEAEALLRAILAAGGER